MTTQTLETAPAKRLGYTGGLTCSLGVTDLAAAMDWYKDVLGFELLYKVDELAWCEMRTPLTGATLGLGQREAAGGAGGATLVFDVSDIDNARGELEAKGVRFDGDTMTLEGMVKLATFFDPDGNTFMLSQSLQG